MLLERYWENVKHTDTAVFIDPVRKKQVWSPQVFSALDNIVSFLSFMGYKEDDKIALYLSNSIEYALLLLAFLNSDLVYVPLPVKSNKEKVSSLLQHSDVRLIIVDDDIYANTFWVKDLGFPVATLSQVLFFDGAHRVSFVPRLESTNRVSCITYTSGTTKNPKGVILSNNALWTKIHDLVGIMPFKSGQRFFSFLPFSSSHGMISGFFVPLFAGCCMLVGKMDSFLAVDVWTYIKDYKVNYFTSVPSILTLLKRFAGNVNHKDINSIIKVFCASAPLSKSLYEWYRKQLGIIIHNCYGLSETASWITVMSETSLDKGHQCVGKVFNANIKIVDQNGYAVGTFEKGEILISSPSNMLGYYANPSEMENIFDGEYIKTGDIGYADDSGNIFLLDRKKNIIIRNGVTIFPLEIGEIVLRHLDVAEVATFGVPDEDYGEKIVTAIVLKDKKRFCNEVSLYIRNNVPPYLMPNDIVFLNEIEKSGTGKVLVSQLIAHYIKQNE